MKKITFFFLVFVLVQNTFAQVHGFLGKRMSITTAILVGPDLFGKDVSHTDKERGGLAFNKRFSIGFDYVLARKWSFSSSFHIQKTATNKFWFDHSIEENLGKTLSYGVSSNGFSFSFSRFLTKKNAFIAPVGRYFCFGAMVSNFNLIDIEGHVFTPNTKIASGSVAGLTVGFGRKRVFFKRVLVDYGIEAAWLFHSAKLNKDDPFNEFITVPQKRIKQVSTLNLKISAGYLL